MQADRRIQRIRWFIAVCLAVVFLTPVFKHFQVKWQLSAYRKKLVAAGEKLEIAELTPPVTPASTNAAAAYRLMQAVPAFRNVYPKAMKFVEPGVARVAWREPVLMQTVDYVKPEVDVWPKLRAFQQTNDQAIRELIEILNNNAVQVTWDYAQMDVGRFVYQAPAMKTAPGLAMLAILDLHDGNSQAAYASMRASGAAMHLLSDNPLMVCQAIRFGEQNITLGALWEALQSDRWTIDQWEVIQKQWDSLDYLESTVATLAMDRARSRIMFNSARQSWKNLTGNFVFNGDVTQTVGEIFSDTLHYPRQGISEFCDVYPRYWAWKWIGSYPDEERYLQMTQRLIDLIRSAQRRRSVLKRLAERRSTEKEDDLVLTMVPQVFDVSGNEELTSAGFAFQSLREQTQAQIAVAAIALKRYHIAHDTYPATLGELAPKLIRQVPIDYMDGKDLRYRPKADGTYLLYSVGGDGVDDGGDAVPPAGSIELTGSLQNGGLKEGRDWVWPRAATPEEVKAAEAREAEKAKAPRFPRNRQPRSK
jgi:hypothetical protein